ncbi:WD40 repeat domain-containing protein [Aquimarina sp. Aq78]|uniref:WD40 repeat domain-containing protein n=1 Tax=Aquimarina sp. Aq78 TaxID=1191889 RepID=UPI000D0E8B08|nr:hypothetical protein [Aquimarina sp. Aq78]
MKNNFRILLIVLWCNMIFAQKSEVFIKSELPVIKVLYNGELDAIFFNKTNKNEIHVTSYDNKYSAIFGGLGFAVLDFDVSKDGKYLVTANQDKSIIIWEIKTKKILKHFRPNQETLHGVSFFDTTSFLSFGEKGKLKKWSINAELLYEINVSNKALNAISKFDNTIIVGGYDKRIRMIDNQTKKIRFEMNIGEIITSISIDKTKKNLYVGDIKGTLNIINLEQSKIVKTIDLHQSVITDICFVNHQYVVTSSWDKMIKFTDIKDFKIKKTFSDHKDYIFSLTTRNKELFSSSRDKRIRIWNMEELKL